MHSYLKLHNGVGVLDQGSGQPWENGSAGFPAVFGLVAAADMHNVEPVQLAQSLCPILPHLLLHRAVPCNGLCVWLSVL